MLTSGESLNIGGEIAKGGSLGEPLGYCSLVQCHLPLRMVQTLKSWQADKVSELYAQLIEFTLAERESQSDLNRSFVNVAGLTGSPVAQLMPVTVSKMAAWPNIAKQENSFPLMGTLSLTTAVLDALQNISSQFVTENWDCLPLDDVDDLIIRLPFLGESFVTLKNQRVRHTELMEVPTSLGRYDSLYTSLGTWIPPALDIRSEKFVNSPDSFHDEFAEDGRFEHSLPEAFSAQMRERFVRGHLKVVPGIRFQLANGVVNAALWVQRLDYSADVCVNSISRPMLRYCSMVTVNVTKAAAYAGFAFKSNEFGGITPVFARPPVIKLEAFQMRVHRYPLKLDWLINLTIRALQRTVKRQLESVLTNILTQMLGDVLFQLMPHYVSVPFTIFGKREEVGIVAMDDPIIDSEGISLNFSYFSKSQRALSQSSKGEFRQEPALALFLKRE